MAYVKQNFVDGNVLYASELNHIEDGIADAALNDLSNVTDATVAGKIGTGAITAAKIAANAVTTQYTATIPETSWTTSGDYKTKTITVNGLLATDKPIIDYNANGRTLAQQDSENEAFGVILSISVTDNSLTINAKEVPEVAIPIKILCIRK